MNPGFWKWPNISFQQGWPTRVFGVTPRTHSVLSEGESLVERVFILTSHPAGELFSIHPARV